MFCTDSSWLESNPIQFKEELTGTFYYNDEALRNIKTVVRLEECQCA